MTRESSDSRAMLDVALICELIRVQRQVIEVAIQQSAEAAIDMLVEYVEDAGIEDAETMALLSHWWASRPRKLL